MNEPTDKPVPSRIALGVLIALGLTTLAPLSSGRNNYPDLHTILDTSIFLLSGLLALLLRDIGMRGRRPFLRWIAVSFALTSLSEFGHTLASLDWSGVLAPMAQSAGASRPATWPPPAHLLPIGIGWAVWAIRRGGHGVIGFTLALVALTAGLFVVFHWLPRYTSPTWLGITRPTLILVPLLWGLAGLTCWRLRAADRMLPTLTLMAVVLLLANLSMLYSRAPHDTQAMVAHLGRVGGYLVLLLSLMQMASFDMLERIRSERELAKLNAQLEGRVLERTAQLGSVNTALEREIAVRRQAEEVLKQSLATSEQALQDLADQKFALDQHAIVAVTDVQGTITYVNDRFCAISKYSADELLGQNHRILNSGHHPKDFFQQMYRTIATGRVWHGEIKNRAKDGSIYWVDTTVVPFITPDGKPRQYVAIRADITERKQAEQALRAQTRMFESVLDSMDEGLITADQDGKFVIWNPAAERILGKSATDLPVKQWTEHYGCYLPDGVTPFPADQLPLVRALGGEPADVEMLIRNPKLDEAVWIEATGRPLRDENGRVQGGVVAFRDVTRAKASDREIRKLNDELEQRVAQRTAQLEEANQELEAFTYSVSHDLRAPLRHMAGFSTLLLEEFGPVLDPQALHYVQRIQEGTRKMGQLVDELLSLARVGRQSLNTQATGLDSIVREVVELLKPDHQGRQVEWQIASLPFIECDPTLMKQVFQNLLSNALKYSRPRQLAVIEVGATQTNGQPVIFVRDNGVGFNMKYADKLFGVFQRLHRAEDFEGTGVGLATVQRIIKKHGGRVWAEAELDRGAAFYFTVGVAEPANVIQVSAAVGAEPLETKTRTVASGGQS